MSFNVQRVGLVAARDYRAVVTSRGFLMGLLLMPVLMLIIFVLFPRIAGSRAPQIEGQVAVIDPTGLVTAELERTVTPAAITHRRQAEASQSPAAANGRSAAAPAAPIPLLNIQALPVDADVDAHKSWLIQSREALPRHLAIVVVKPDAVAKKAGSGSFGGYELYVSSRLEDAAEGTLRESLRAALIAARLRHAGSDPQAVADAEVVTQPDAVVVSPQGDRTGTRGFARWLPLACGVLIFIAVLTGGQILMTSTVEEKSNRVVEVLLAALSPLELMTGKLLGQLAVGLTVTAVYITVALYGLAQISLAGLLDPLLIVYVLAFYVVTFLVFGSLMMAVGSVVEQVADAQALMGPIMILLIAGYSVTPVIGAAPNSVLSVALSFTPFVNTFAMLARVASSAPPPGWQVALTLLIGCATAALVITFAAKVFKIALLLHGKPPSIGTLIRWARMA